MKKRFALLLGGPHAGTTRLFGSLGRHPQVLPCRVKEPHFFSDDRKWELGIDWYRSLWDFEEPDERVAIEASGDYARHPTVACPAARIASTPAGFRFVFVLRDPVERVEAWHATRVAEGRAESASGLRDLAEEIAASRAATQLAAYREHFPREDFLLLAHDEWLRSPQTTLERVCCFLEIDPGFRFPEPLAGKSVPQSRRSWLRRLFGPRREPRAALPTLSGGVREALVRELSEERERLAGEWGFDTSGWCGSEPT